MKILVVDDSTFMRTMIKGSIKNSFEDVTFFEAANGQDGVELYKRELPDLVMMDITMNIMNGIEATRQIKQFDKNCRIIMLSALGQKCMIMEAIDAGAKDFIVKPFLDEKLMETITKYIKN